MSKDDNNLMSLSAPQFTYYQLGTDILETDFLNNPEDSLDEAFNKVEYAMTKAILSLYNNNSPVITDMVNKVNSNQNKLYNLIDYSNENPAINTTFNSIFSQSFSDFSNYGNDWRNYVNAKYKYDINYTPFISFANLTTINPSKPVYIASALEIDETKFPNFDDNVPMWIKSSNGTQFTTINSGDAFLIENPILVIVNGTIGDEYQTGVDLGDDDINPSYGTIACSLPSHLHETLTHKGFKINHRFESSGNRSEYRFYWATTTGFDPVNWIWYQKPGQQIFVKERKVNKNDVGSVYFNWEFDVYKPSMYDPIGGIELCLDIPRVTTEVSQTFVVGAYEHDWSRSKKRLGDVKNTTSTEIEILGKRKYYNDWYFHDPATNNSYPFYSRNPTQHSTYTNTERGILKLHRWN